MGPDEIHRSWRVTLVAEFLFGFIARGRLGADDEFGGLDLVDKCHEFSLLI
jgi:hypothetical protein